jgi:hypothetical protein
LPWTSATPLTAGDDRDDGGVAERELEGGVDEAGAVGLADGLDAGHAVEDRLRRGVVVVEGPGAGAGGEDAGVVGAADDDARAAAQAEGEERGERLLFQQRVAAGEEEDVEIAVLEQPLGVAPVVDAGAEALDDALVAKLHERPVAARHELLPFLDDALFRAEVEGIEAVGVEDVDPVDPEAFEREFHAAHDGVVGVVHDLGAGGDVEPFAEAVALVGGGRLEEAADLRGEHVASRGLPRRKRLSRVSDRPRP